MNACVFEVTFIEQIKSITNNKDSVKKIINLYSKHAAGDKKSAEEFFEDLNSVIMIAEFVEKVGGRKMAFEIL